MSNQREQERQRGKRRADRHEKRQQMHSGGGDWDCIHLPEGIEVFKPEKGQTYHIDVIPYIVGEHNKNAEKGDEYFELSYPVYRNLGIDDKKHVAIGELKGVPDPVAEYFAAQRKAGKEWEDIKQFKPAWRQLFLFFVHEEADKELQLFEGAYGTFGELLDEEIKGSEESYIDNFDDPDAGATLVVRFKEKDIGQKNKWVLASKINFEEREEGFNADGKPKLAKAVLAKAAEICLDDLLKIPDYATLEKALNGEPTVGEDEDDDDKPATKREPRRGKDKEPDEDEDVDEDEETEKGKPAKKKVEPDDEEAAAVAKTMKKEKERIAAKHAEKEEEEDEDDDDAPPPKKKRATAETLGIAKGDTVEHDEHGTCTVLRIAEDGGTLSLMDADDNVHKGVDVTDVEPVEEKETPPKGKGEGASSAGKTKPSSKDSAKNAPPQSPSKKGDDDWDDDWDDEDGEKPAGKKAKADDEDDEPAPKKKK